MAVIDDEEEKEEGEESEEENVEVILCLNIPSIVKVVSGVSKDDGLVLSSEDGSEAETVNFFITKGKNGMQSFDLKVLRCEIPVYTVPPDTEYLATIRMSSVLFKQTVTDLSKWGATCNVEVSNEGVSFSAEGDDGNSRILFRNKNSAEKGDTGDEVEEGAEKGEEEEGAEAGEEEEQGGEEEEEEDSPPKKKKTKKTSKKKATKRKAAPKKKKTTKKTAAKKTKAPKIDPVDDVEIVVQEPIQVALALNYLTKFTKGTSLSDFVVISLHEEFPCRVAYILNETSHVHFHLAPRINDDDDDNDDE